MCALSITHFHQDRTTAHRVAQGWDGGQKNTAMPKCTPKKKKPKSKSNLSADACSWKGVGQHAPSARYHVELHSVGQVLSAPRIREIKRSSFHLRQSCSISRRLRLCSSLSCSLQLFFKRLVLLNDFCRCCWSFVPVVDHGCAKCICIKQV